MPAENKKYIPDFTEKSPYAGCGGIVSHEEPLTGTLTVKAKYLKNESITDKGKFDNNPAEFTWDIRSRAYSGDELPGWDSLAIKDKWEHIEINKAINFSGLTMMYDFNGKKGPHILELDSQITEVDYGAVSIINPDDPVTKYGKPIIYLTYDSKTKCWTLASDATNGVYTNGPVSFTKNFTLSDNETKNFIIILPGGKENGNGTMELCYELSWKAE